MPPAADDNDAPPPEEDDEPQGTTIRVVSTKYGGYSYRSLLSVSMADDAIMLNWRTYPAKLGAEIAFVKTLELSNQALLTLRFEGDHELAMQFEDQDTCAAMHACLDSLRNEALEMEREKREAAAPGSMPAKGGKAAVAAAAAAATATATASRSMHAVRFADFQATMTQELAYQLTASLRLREGDLVCRRLIAQRDDRDLSSAFYRWTALVKAANVDKMDCDRRRWRLHAIANQELDLQAWYHAVFYGEVYRLRGPFWYKDAILPTYRTSYDIVDNTLTPLEEAALAHVLCSPDTVYADVAGQMFVVQALTTPAQFALFQSLASHGANVVKYPRQGRPARKLFRFSFVEGKIYLTWKGKFGNQGVDLGEVSHVSLGIGTDVLKKAFALNGLGMGSPDLYLSVVCAGRSVDLCFEKKADRDAWGGLLGTLCNKEHGSLVGVPSVCPPTCSVAMDDIYEWGFLYEALGSTTVPVEACDSIMGIDVVSAAAAADDEDGPVSPVPSDASKSPLRNSLTNSLQNLHVDPSKKGGRILLQRKPPSTNELDPHNHAV